VDYTLRRLKSPAYPIERLTVPSADYVAEADPLPTISSNRNSQIFITGAVIIFITSAVFEIFVTSAVFASVATPQQQNNAFSVAS